MNTNRALEFLQAIYMNEELPLLTRVRVAISCLPFETPKLLATAIINEQDFATLLDQRLEHLKKLREQEPKLIEAKAEPEPEPAPTQPTPAPLSRLYNTKLYPRRF